jgi:hypothetical protein
MKRFGLLLLAALLWLPTALRAQLAIYGAGSGATFSNADTNVGYGGLAGIYKQTSHALHRISVGADLHGTFVGREGFHYYTGAAGPRIAFHFPVLPLSPYVEGLVGAANFNAGRGTNSSTHFNYQAVGGLDATILPHIDWRVIDLTYSGVASESISAFTFSTGIVIRFF